jgi:hypothetical protein
MGSAFTAISDDVSALLWNPAGLGTLQDTQAALFHNFWLVDTFQDSLIIGFPMEHMGGFAGMLQYMGYGTFAGRDPSGAITGDYSVDKLGFMAGWGNQWAPGLYGGSSIRGDFQSATGKTYGIFSLDLGALYIPSPRISFGLAVIDVGGDQASALTAAALRVGFAYKPDVEKPHALTLAFDGTIEFQGLNRVEVGAEYSLESKYFLRAGGQWVQQDDQIQGLKSFTAGAGIKFEGFQLDYAFVPYGDLGTSHQLSLIYELPQDKAKPEVAAPTPTPTPAPSNGPPVSFRPKPGMDTNPLLLQFDVPPDQAAQAQSMEDQGHPAEARALYQQAVDQEPHDASAWAALGSFYYRQGQKAQAIDCFEQVLQLRPDAKAMADWLAKYKAAP